MTDDDTERILLASWLDVYGLHQYGGRLIASGITSPLHLVETTDAALVRAGIRAIGHRRQIFRYLREDEALHERLEKAREEAEKADLERRQLMQRRAVAAFPRRRRRQPAAEDAAVHRERPT